MKKIFLLLSPLLLNACASPGPIIDKGVNFDPVQYERDYADCQAYQKQVRNKAGGGALGGAIVGGLIGAITGDIGESAAVGAVAGGAGGVGDTAQEKRQVLHNCLRARGYKVLN